MSQESAEDGNGKNNRKNPSLGMSKIAINDTKELDLAFKTPPKSASVPAMDGSTAMNIAEPPKFEDSSTLSLTDRRRLLIIHGYTFSWIDNHLEFWIWSLIVRAPLITTSIHSASVKAVPDLIL